MKQSKVAIIRNAAPQDFGGGERFPVFLAQVLAEDGYAPLVISRSHSLLAFARSQDIATVRGWWLAKQNWSGPSYLLFPFYVIWQLLLIAYYFVLFRRRQIDIIHAQSKDDFIAATLAGKLLGKNIIWTDHADLKHILLNTGRPLRNPSGKLVRWAMKYTNAVTVVSESEKNLVGKQLTASPQLLCKLQVVYNGAYDNFPRNNNDQPAKPTIDLLFAGRIVHDKGIGETIEAVTSLHGAYPQLRLDVIGDGPDAANYRHQVKNRDYIVFHGHQDNPTSWMSAADIFIQATYHEGFSLALVEASMMQLPIIATGVGGNPEIITDHQTGLLVPPKDSLALSEAIKELIDQPDLRQTLARNARKQYLGRFQFDKIVKDKFIPLYEKSTD